MFELNEKLRGLAAYQPVEARGCVRLDANESFLPLPQAVWEAFCQALSGLEYNRYPDPAAKELCGAFAQYYGIDPQTVVAGNGSDELISVIFQGFLMKGQAFDTLDPDFSMYAQAGALAEARHVSIGKRDFQISPEEVVEACRREKVRLLIFSNPCNPTSLALDREAVRHILKGVEALVVLDEAYMDFSDQSLLEEASQYSNLIILRTCSKALGMAAARLGFAVANPKLAGALRAAKAPYNVNAMSQALGLAALRRGDLLDQARAQVLASRDQLLAGLRALAQARPGRFRVLPCAANFAALVMPQAQRAQELLLSRGVAVRFTGGLLRVTCGQPEENRRFLQEFEKIWEELP